MQRIIDDNEAIARLVNGDWVQLAVFDAESNRIKRYVEASSSITNRNRTELPVVDSSIDWYRGRREHSALRRLAIRMRSKHHDARNALLRARHYRRRQPRGAAVDLWRDSRCWINR